MRSIIVLFVVSLVIIVDGFLYPTTTTTRTTGRTIMSGRTTRTTFVSTCTTKQRKQQQQLYHRRKIISNDMSISLSSSSTSTSTIENSSSTSNNNTTDPETTTILMKNGQQNTQQTSTITSSTETDTLTITSSSSTKSSTTVTTTNNNNNIKSLPWTERQELALRYHVPRYTINVNDIIDTNNNVNTNNQNKNNNNNNVYILWRNLCNDVIELNGYPIVYLQEQYYQYLLLLSSSSSSQNTNNATNTKLSTNIQVIVPKIPYYINNYYFEMNGGLCGNVYNIPGIADGTIITTSSIYNIQSTLSQQYIITLSKSTSTSSSTTSTSSDNSIVVYELGTPKILQDSTITDTNNKAEYDTINFNDNYFIVPSIFSKATKAIAKSSSTSSSTEILNSIPSIDNDDGKDLLYLGTLTAIVLGGATAINLLSHHLTVNVFWV